MYWNNTVLYLEIYWYITREVTQIYKHVDSICSLWQYFRYMCFTLQLLMYRHIMFKVVLYIYRS